MADKIADADRVHSVFCMLRSGGVLRDHAVRQVNIGLKDRGFKMKCQRCYKETKITTGSYFDTAMICLPCDKIEQSHPEYASAKQTENEHVKSGDLNFKGVGLPSDWSSFFEKSRR